MAISSWDVARVSKNSVIEWQRVENSQVAFSSNISWIKN